MILEWIYFHWDLISEKESTKTQGTDGIFERRALKAKQTKPLGGFGFYWDLVCLQMVGTAITICWDFIATDFPMLLYTFSSKFK